MQGCSIFDHVLHHVHSVDDELKSSQVPLLTTEVLTMSPVGSALRWGTMEKNLSGSMHGKGEALSHGQGFSICRIDRYIDCLSYNPIWCNLQVQDTNWHKKGNYTSVLQLIKNTPDGVTWLIAKHAKAESLIVPRFSHKKGTEVGKPCSIYFNYVIYRPSLEQQSGISTHYRDTLVGSPEQKSIDFWLQ